MNLLKFNSLNIDLIQYGFDSIWISLYIRVVINDTFKLEIINMA